MKKVLEPIQEPVPVHKVSLPKLQLELSPVSFKTDIKLTPIETDFDFSLEDLSLWIVLQNRRLQTVPSVDYTQTFAEAQVDQAARRTKFIQPQYPKSS